MGQHKHNPKSIAAKKGLIPPRPDKKEMERQLTAEIIQRWTAQFCLDIMTLVLNDPAVMGKDVLGKKRLRIVEAGFNEEYSKYIVGLSSDVEASYARAKLDERLEKIDPDRFEEWPDRYFLWDDKGI